MDTSTLLQYLVEPLIGALSRFAGYLPSIAAAFLLLLLGLFLARLMRTAVDRFLSRVKLDEYTSKVGINEVLLRLGLGKSPSYVFTFLIYWFVLFVFFVSASNALNMLIVSELLEKAVVFLPSLVTSIIVLFAGLLFARFLSEVIGNAAAANNIRGGNTISKSAYFVIVAFSVMTALEQLGLRFTFLIAAFQIVLASMGLALALALGLGGKDIAAEKLRAYLNDHKK